MPPYSSTSPLKEINLRKLVGSACYVGSALTYDAEWNTTKLEKVIENRVSGRCTGRYRRMTNGIVPSNPICKLIQNGQDGEITKWRNSPYWILFITKYSHIKYLNFFQNTMYMNWSSAESLIFRSTNHEFNTEKYYRYWEDRDYDDFLNIDDLLSQGILFDIFAQYTSWTREAREKNHLQPMYECGNITRMLFPKAVCNTPQLFIKWPLLALIYKKLIWNKPYYHGKNPWFDMKWNKLFYEIETEEKIARDNGVKLIPKHLFRKINPEYKYFTSSK